MESNNATIYFSLSRRFLLFCRIRQTRLYFGPYNSKKRLLTILAANISLALRRLTTMLDTLVWSRSRTVKHSWLWKLLLAGLREDSFRKPLNIPFRTPFF